MFTLESGYVVSVEVTRLKIKVLVPVFMFYTLPGTEKKEET